MRREKVDSSIVELVYQAKGNSLKADSLIYDYLPFIKSVASKATGKSINDSSDELSIAMIGFHQAIESYSKLKGSFLKYAALIMKNRLIDYYRSEKKHQDQISLETPIYEEDLTLMDTLEDENNQFDSLDIRNATREEILELSKQLLDYGLSLTDIADNSPKQNRTLNSCKEVISYVKARPEIIDEVLKSKKLPLAKLSLATGVEKKTLERHRKYLMALIIIYSNGYEIIRGHLKQVLNIKKEGEIV